MRNMRRRISVGGGAAAALVGLTIIAVSNLNSAGAGSAVDARGPIPAGKSAAAGPAKAFTGQLPQTPTASLMPAIADAGDDPQAVAKVKSDAINDLAGLKARMRLPANVSDRVPMVADPRQVVESQQRLQQVIATTKVAEWVTTVQTAVKAVASDPTYQAYQDNRFVVDSWQGVTIDGSNASVLLKGHDSYFDARGWADDTSRQWQLQLALESGTWKLVSQQSLSLPAVGPSNLAKRP